MQLCQRLPSRLPLTVAELDKMIGEILVVNDLPDNPSYKHAIASAIMHLGPVTNKKSYSFFAKSVHKAISNHVAYDKMKQLEKEEQEKKELQDSLAKDGDVGSQSPEGQVVS